MTLKVYLNTLKTGIFLSFISVFLVFKNLLFPYITSKQLFFNILVEILAIFWLALIVKYPTMRPFGSVQGKPKKSWITRGLVLFLAALFISSVFGVDFNLSFWGDIERMLGLFHVAHFFLFYLIVITAFRNWSDWRNLFIVSVAAAVGVCLYSLLEIPYSTIGNTAYVSGYAIFNFYFALILFFKNKKQGGGWLIGALYLIAAFIMALVLKQTHTRGAYVGLGVSLMLMFFLFAFYNRSKKIKIYSLSAAVMGVILVSLVFMFPQSRIVKQSSILNTITQITSKASTFQTRLISWEAALKDFPDHPILGTGYGNFAITFDKYFDPKFYLFTSSETYFDRAHNNLVDIASTAGSLGLFSYLSIFVACFYYLFKGKKENKISVAEFILLLCLFVAYFIQNLAVFDSLITYISLMMALGFIYWLVNGDENEKIEDNEAGFNNKEIYALFIAGAVLLCLIYQANLRVWFMLDDTIKGQIELQKGNILGAVEAYKHALSYKTGLDRDSRGSLINALTSRQSELMSLTQTEATGIVEYAVDLAEKNVKLNPLDSMMQLQLAQILNVVAIVNQNDQDKFYFYSNRALEAVDKSIAASPGRATIYFSKAQIYLTRNEKDKAIEILRYAAGLEPNYAEPVCYLARVEFYLSPGEEAYADMDKCLDLGQGGYINSVDFVKSILEHYAEKKDQPRLLILCKRWTQLEPNNAKAWINLSLAYEEAGDNKNAIAAAEQAASLDHSLRQAADEFIKKLKN